MCKLTTSELLSIRKTTTLEINLLAQRGGFRLAMTSPHSRFQTWEVQLPKPGGWWEVEKAGTKVCKPNFAGTETEYKKAEPVTPQCPLKIN